ncbi:MAG: NAD-dependent epimerase/dehydratase family protein [Candidatus Dormibacteraeota bacterium]|nr:NAD-dependent epimerase/dehydratase family protein [Candidatus Dormibacteraeota bacterium]
MKKTVAITGARGYVGSMLSRHFEAAGWTVTRLSHTAGAGGAVAFQLGEDVSPELFRARTIGALVHCAYDFRPVKWAEIQRINVEGSRKLLTAARAGEVERIAVISTISAFEGCRSLYGRAKLEIEAAAADVGALVVRAGLVYGDGDPTAGGMFGSLATSVRRGLVPLIDGGIHPQYLIHEADLWRLLKGFCDRELENPGKPVVAASPQAWPLRDLLAELARRQGRHPRFVTVPWLPIWVGLWVAELAHLPVPYRSDSVVSLVHQDRKPDFESLRAVGITARDFTAT